MYVKSKSVTYQVTTVVSLKAFSDEASEQKSVNETAHEDCGCLHETIISFPKTNKKKPYKIHSSTFFLWAKNSLGICLESVFSACSPLQPTFHDILQQDLDMLVPVGATVLVVEAQSVEQLVLDRPEVNAALEAQRHYLPVTLAAQVGVTSMEMLDRTGSSSKVYVVRIVININRQT